MSAIWTGLVIFLFVIGAGFTGIGLRTVLPEDNFLPESKDSMRLIIGLVVTMTALLIGLLIASAKSSFDVQQNRVIEMAAKVRFLERVLFNYGPDAAAVRMLVKEECANVIERMWPAHGPSHAKLAPFAVADTRLYDAIQGLVPQTQAQEGERAHALQTGAELAQLYSLLFAQASMSISRLLVNIVVVWLMFIFLTFGLFAPRNLTVIAELVVAAVAVSTALFLVLEFDRSFGGVIGVSGEPMRKVLKHFDL